MFSKGFHCTDIESETQLEHSTNLVRLILTVTEARSGKVCNCIVQSHNVDVLLSLKARYLLRQYCPVSYTHLTLPTILRV